MSESDLQADIIHIVNLLVCSARDGGSGTPHHAKLYKQFKNMVKKLDGEHEKVCNWCWRQLLPETERTQFECTCGRRIGYVRPTSCSEDGDSCCDGCVHDRRCRHCFQESCYCCPECGNACYDHKPNCQLNKTPMRWEDLL